MPICEVKFPPEKKKKNILTLGGESIESFEKHEEIESIILIGKKGGIRRIQIKERENASK